MIKKIDSTLGHWMLLLMLSLIWGSSFILIKKGLEAFNYEQVATLRIFIAFIFLAVMGRKFYPNIPIKKLWPLILTGFIGNGIPPFLFSKAQTYLDSGIVGILNVLTPLFTIFIGILFYNLKIKMVNYLVVLFVEGVNKPCQQSNHQNISELLIWLFVQEKNFDAALDQEKAMDQKWDLNQKKVFELANICRKNKAFDIALQCYKYIIEIGPDSRYFLDAQLSLLTVNKELLESDPTSSKEKWLQLETKYIESLNSLGRTSYTILLIRDLAALQAFRLHDIKKASTTIKEALNISSASPEDLAECKLIFADILLLQNEIWDAILTYSQVDKAYKHDVLGHEAKFRRAKISYYQGDFNWAQAQLDVLKKSTSKLIANNAMELSLLIQDNLNLDTTTITMEIFSRADLLIYQNKLDEAYATLDSIVIDYQGHSLVDEALFRQYNIKLKEGKKEDASELLDQIINFFSFDILADDAKFAQAQLQENYFKNTDRASELYQDIISNHQDSFFLSESRKRYRTLRGE